MCGVFASPLVIFSREARLSRPMTVQILGIGLVITFSTFALNPRRDDANVLRWSNNLMRTAIALAVGCITVAVVSAFLDGAKTSNRPLRVSVEPKSRVGCQ